MRTRRGGQNQCKAQNRQQRDGDVTKVLPQQFDQSGASGESAAQLSWDAFFDDPHLNALIDSALEHNQELNIVSLEILIAQNEVLARSGEYLPRVELRGGGGVRREGEDTTRFEKESNDGEYLLGLFASWEIDVWKKLRNARSAAAKRYLEAFLKRTSASRPALGIALEGEVRMARATLGKISAN